MKDEEDFTSPRYASRSACQTPQRSSPRKLPRRQTRGKQQQQHSNMKCLEKSTCTLCRWPDCMALVTSKLQIQLRCGGRNCSPRAISKPGDEDAGKIVPPHTALFYFIFLCNIL